MAALNGLGQAPARAARALGLCVVVGRLLLAAETMAVRLEGVTPPDLQRPGRRGDGAVFTVDTIARYMIHDPIHHVWDVTTASG